MAIVTTQISLDVNSDAKDGAQDIDLLGSAFTINLEQPVTIPSDAFNATVRVEEATVWNTVHNVALALNNNHIFISDNAVVLDITIPDGTYSTASLSSAIEREYVSAGGTSGLVSLDEDFPTNRVLVTVDGTLAAGVGAFVDWTAARVNTFRDVIGIDPAVAPGFGLIPRTGATLLTVVTLADNEAAFNNIEYFKIHSDIGQGIRTNNSFRQTVARVNIDVAPGTQIVSAPNNPARSEMARWIGQPKTQIRFWLTDQKDTLVETGEIWSARLVLEYQQFHAEPLGAKRRHNQAFRPVKFGTEKPQTGTT